MAEHHFDVVVLGAGSGLTAAYHAGEDGKRVAVVEARPDALGGTCVNRGCIPTKGLIQVAEVMRTVRTAGQFGITLDQSSVRPDFGAVMRTIRERRAGDAAATRDWVESSFQPFYERARFIDDRVLELASGDRLRGDVVFITSGARPARPPIDGLDAIEPWTNEEVLEATAQPATLIILGGGYIGVELGHFFSSIGTWVTMIDRGDCLTREDHEIREVFTEHFQSRVTLLRHHQAVRALRDGDASGLVVRDPNGDERQLFADRVLVATGRRPNTDGLGLDTTGVELDGDGWIRVDDHLRTTRAGIYAYGDVIGRAMFKHTSSYEGGIAYRNAQGADLAVSYRANPHAVFSDPEIAAVGLREEDCRQRGIAHRVARKPYDSVARGRIAGSPPGLAKLIVEESTDRILGFHVVGPHAAELVHEVVVAMNAGDGTAGALREAIHIHPTLSELVASVFAAARE